MKMSIKPVLQLSGMVLIFLASCEEQMNEEKPVVTNKKSDASRERLTSNYTLTGKEGDPIDYQVARKWVMNYQEKYESGNVAHFFGYEIIKDILALEGCVGIRMYYALDDSGERQIILVGVDEKGNNIIPNANGRTAEEGILGDMSFPCPTFCSGGETSL